GDIISVDVGVILNGFHGDAARTYAVGEVSRKARRLLRVTEECLRKAIAVLRPGVLVSRISAAIEAHAQQHGFSVVRKFVGHGIGRSMHEPPQVPNYVSRFFADSRLALPAGATLAIEPMVNVGGSDVRILDNGWTVVTKDRSLSAHFEHTVAITADGPAVLTELA
ncbi:MAG: type I methionyl aminopeptidase, partial [Planctomycetota bacterium]|nr:type I methionyl aminopeptidase [Planctomycetota bacterium]